MATATTKGADQMTTSLGTFRKHRNEWVVFVADHNAKGDRCIVKTASGATKEVTLVKGICAHVDIYGRGYLHTFINGWASDDETGVDEWASVADCGPIV